MAAIDKRPGSTVRFETRIEEDIEIALPAAMTKGGKTTGEIEHVYAGSERLKRELVKRRLRLHRESSKLRYGSIDDSKSSGQPSVVGLSMDSKQLLVEALHLPDEERAALAGELIGSLDRDVDADAEAAWATEIRARLARVDAGTAKTVSWAEARRRIYAAAGRGSGA